MEATIEHLKETGFPIFKNSRGETMVYLKKNRKIATDRYKYEKMRELQAEYDIHYFFDDLQKNRDKALSLGVIGVYHLPAHLGIKQNPSHLNCGCGQTPCKTYGVRANVPTGEQPPDSFGVSLKTLIEQQTNKPLNPQAEYPLKKQYYQAVLKSNKPLPGEVIILGGAALRKKDIAVENELRSLGWTIGAQSPTKHALGDLNVGRIERMRKGSDAYKGRGIYVHKGMFGPGFKPTPTNPAHPIYEKAGIAAIQFRPGLVMTNYSRVLMKRGNGPFEVMAGNITVPDPNTGVVGVPRTKFTTQAESFFYGRRNSGAGMHVGTRIPNYEYQDLYTHFYWPMRLPEMYLDTTAPRTPLLEDDADGGMILTQEDYQQRVIDSLPPGWQQPAKERMGSLGPYQRPGDSWERLNPPNTEVPAGYREAAGCMVQRASDGKILFLRRSPKETSKHGLYEFPGGKLEDGETAREAALIETEEEAGLKVKIIRQLDSHVDHSMKKVYHCFLAVPKKGARVKLSEEHDKFMWAGPNKKWPKSKLSHHARYMINQLHDSDSEYHKYIDKVHEILTIEGGAAGLSALKPAFPKKTSKKKAESLLAKMPGVVQHADGDYILVTGLSNPALPNPLPSPKKKNGRKEPSKNYVKRMMGNTKMRAEFPDAGQRYAVTLKLVEKHYGKATRKRIAPRENGWFSRSKPVVITDNYGTQISQGTISTGSGVDVSVDRDNNVTLTYPQSIMFNVKIKGLRTTNATLPEVSLDKVGHGNQVKFNRDTGMVADIRTEEQIAGERMVQKALDRLPPREKRVNEFNQDVAFTAPTFDEIMDSIPDVDDIPQEEMNEMFARYGIKPTRNNPRKPLDGMEDKKVAKAKKAYKKFHGGKEPTDMKKETIDVGDVWYALGPCWSIGYMSPKETGEDDQKYIHHTNEDSKDGNFPMMYATMPENGEPMIVIKGGSMKIGMRDGLAWLID